MLEQSVQP
jgi:hypothetical protein